MTATELTGHLDQKVEADRDVFVAGNNLFVQLGAATDSVSGRAATPVRTAARYSRHHPIFVQYLNPEVLYCYGQDIKTNNNHQFLTNALHATRLAVLVTNEYLVLPASYFFEIPHFSRFLALIADLVHAGQVRYVAPLPDLAIYRESKAEEYRDDPRSRYRLSHRALLSQARSMAWLPRQSKSTATDIATSWCHAVTPEGELRSVVRATARQFSGQRRASAEQALISVPERLDGRAFVGRFVRHLVPCALTQANSTHIDLFLSKAYLASYLADLDAMMLVDFHFGDLSCGVGHLLPGRTGLLVSARRIELVLKWLYIDEYIHRIATWMDLLSLRSEPEFDVVMLEAYSGRSTTRISQAVSRARRSTIVTVAGDLIQAKRNVEVVANLLLDSIHD